MHVFLEFRPRSEEQDRSELVLMQNSSHVDFDIQISVLFVFSEGDGRKSLHIKKVLD